MRKFRLIKALFLSALLTMLGFSGTVYADSIDDVQDITAYQNYTISDISSIVSDFQNEIDYVNSLTGNDVSSLDIHSLCVVEDVAQGLADGSIIVDSSDSQYDFQGLLAVLYEHIDFTPNEDGQFVYELTPWDPEWAQLISHDEMVEVSRIPQLLLDKMTTEQLLDASMSYPLMIVLIAYSTPDMGLQAFTDICDAYREYLLRSDHGLSVLLEKYDDINTTGDGFNSSMIRGGLNMTSGLNIASIKDRAKLICLKAFIRQDAISGSTPEFPFSDQLYAVPSTIRTPNGTTVYFTTRGDLSLEDKIAADFIATASYPAATLVASSNGKYNCHSYAWYYQSTANDVWIPSAAAYVTDGSYYSFSSVVAASSGDRLYYDGGAHSAIVYGYPGNLSSPKYINVISKWGQGPLMIHQAYYSPYSSNNITMWKR